MATTADVGELSSWSRVARAAADALAKLSPATLNSFDGARITGVGPCRRCSMSFASEAVESIDPRCEFVSSLGKDLIYLPAGLNVVQCPFCGEEAHIDTPAMFYTPHRAQIIYCLPSRTGLSRDQLVELYRPIIPQIRHDYVASLTEEEARRFQATAELTTYSWSQFLYAVQMGETIPEGHVFNFAVFADGTGMLIDWAKGFVQTLTRSEMKEFLSDARGVMTGPLVLEELERSRNHLEEIVQSNPGDDFAHKQLATVALTIARMRATRQSRSVVEGMRGTVRG